jgi:hypothetical protein
MKKALSTSAIIVLGVIIVLIVVADYVMPSGSNPPVSAVNSTSTTTVKSATPTKPVVTSKTPVESPVTYVTTITQKQNNQVVNVKKGVHFTLALGEFDWTVLIGDTATVGQIQNFQVVRGVQGTYVGLKPGMTTIRAEGRPHCDSGKGCSTTVINFKTTVVVK